MKSKRAFLEEYHLEEVFEKACSMQLNWKKLQDIYSDYKRKYYDYYQKMSQEIVAHLSKKAPSEVKIIYARAKDPDHLIEKIIRKVGKEDKAAYKDINVDNYRRVITDLIGIRILTLKKEDWDAVDSHIHNKMKTFIEEPVAYVCYGDRDIFDEKRIRTDYTNKGYRSQHYVIDYKDIPCEIQVRTLAEEVYGEFDHKVRYPYKADNKFLERYNRIIAKVTSELDDLISTCSALTDDNFIELNHTFTKDKYVDWQKKILDEGSISNNDKERNKKDEKEENRLIGVSLMGFVTNKLTSRKGI